MRRTTVFVIPILACSACAALLGIDQDYSERETNDAGLEAARDATSQGDGGGPLGSDGSSGGASDASSVASELDAGCLGHVCNGVCLPGTDCASCVSGALFCAGSHACVGTCGACGGTRAECWACPGGGPPRGSCEVVPGAFCLGSAYEHCGCDASADDCPGASNVCVTKKCETCGASGASTDGKRCKGQTDCAALTRQCN